MKLRLLIPSKGARRRGGADLLIFVVSACFMTQTCSEYDKFRGLTNSEGCQTAFRSRLHEYGQERVSNLSVKRGCETLRKPRLEGYSM